MAKTVIVAMSGGVDSSVAAYLLRQQGYIVVGVTMNIWQDEQHTDVPQAIKDARNVAEILQIPFHVIDVRETFKRKVIEPFIEEYLIGRTPNPCILCNKNIKWSEMLEEADKLGGDFIATGHYASVAEKDGRYSLKKAINDRKDQTYALYSLSQEQLKKTLMPLGEYSKEEIRDIAKTAGLPVFDKPDSQEICFVSDDNHSAFIAGYMGRAEEPGDFVFADGTVVGSHRGISNYTIGQRKGLGISHSEPLFVQSIDVVGNSVVLGSNEQLFKTTLTVKDVNYMSVDGAFSELSCFGKIRYAHPGAKCVIMPTGVDDELLCVFEEPQRAITSGQSAVFYDKGGVVVAGGVIK